MVEKIPVAVGQLIGGAGGTDEQVVQPDGHHGPDLFHGVVRGQSQSVAADDFLVFQFQGVLVHTPVFVPAHAPVKAINGFALVGQLQHGLPSLSQTLIGRRVNLHRTALTGNGIQVLQRQVMSGQSNSIQRLRLLSKSWMTWCSVSIRIRSPF